MPRSARRDLPRAGRTSIVTSTRSDGLLLEGQSPGTPPIQVQLNVPAPSSPGPDRRGEDQASAKSRRLGPQTPSSYFPEGGNPPKPRAMRPRASKHYERSSTRKPRHAVRTSSARGFLHARHGTTTKPSLLRTRPSSNYPPIASVSLPTTSRASTSQRAIRQCTDAIAPARQSDPLDERPSFRQ